MEKHSLSVDKHKDETYDSKVLKLHIVISEEMQGYGVTECLPSSFFSP